MTTSQYPGTHRLKIKIKPVQLIWLTYGMAMRMQKYAVHADYAHIREYADENLIHIPHYPHINIYQKMAISWAKNGSAWLCFQFYSILGKTPFYSMNR